MKITKKGISTDVIAIIFLIIGLAIFALLFLKFGAGGKETLSNLSNATAPLKAGWGV